MKQCFKNSLEGEFRYKQRSNQITNNKSETRVLARVLGKKILYNTVSCLYMKLLFCVSVLTGPPNREKIISVLKATTDLEVNTLTRLLHYIDEIGP